ncbi:S24 family peptidase [Marinagarivorans algicola]|uniref:S24 family peptidase n=1 Tax=Marinagarivorans algicola TaxID=1513270 RepID=UPI0006B4D8E7|nr:S24 family peptidase [Marinagarivorans algicola]
MDYLESIIKTRRKELKLTQKELGQKVGVSHVNVGGWERGEYKPKGEHLILLSSILSLKPDEIINNTQSKYKHSAAEPQANHMADKNLGLVPVISWVQAGGWGEAIDICAAGDAERYLPCAKQHSASTYALIVQGDSMTSPSGRSYPEGCVIFVEPELRGSVIPGDRVIAKLEGSNAVTFKQFAMDGDIKYLKPLNTQHKPIFDPFRILGKIIGTWIDE